MQISLTPQEIESLWHDKAYGILTRPAFEIMYERRVAQGETSWAVLLDIDGIHNFNSLHASENSDGYEYTDSLLRAAFEEIQVRSSDLVYMGRYKSGDEIGCLIKMEGNPQQFCERLLQCLQARGLSATFAYVQAGDDFHATFKQAGIVLQAAKKSNNRGTVTRR